jgi:hypothetical protein
LERVPAATSEHNPTEVDMKKMQLTITEELYALISRCAEVFNTSKSAVFVALLDQTEIDLPMIDSDEHQ